MCAAAVFPSITRPERFFSSVLPFMRLIEPVGRILNKGDMEIFDTQSIFEVCLLIHDGIKYFHTVGTIRIRCGARVDFGTCGE